jgi:hypothetical protein
MRDLHHHGFPLLLWDALMKTGYRDRAPEYYGRDGISPCTIGPCGPLHGGYQDNIIEDSNLEDIILGQYLRGQHLSICWLSWPAINM